MTSSGYAFWKSFKVSRRFAPPAMPLIYMQNLGDFCSPQNSLVCSRVLSACGSSTDRDPRSASFLQLFIMLIPFTPYVSALKYESYQTVKKSEPIVRVKKSEPYEAVVKHEPVVKHELVVKHEPVAKCKSVAKSERAVKYELVAKPEHTSSPPPGPPTNRFPIAIAGRCSVDIGSLLTTPPHILKKQIPAYTLRSIHGCGFSVITLSVYVRLPDRALWRMRPGDIV